MINHTLDHEEQELLQSIESGEWESVENLDEEIEKYQEIARNTLKKDKRINIRLSTNDLEALKTNAIELGMPYQTLVSSVLHQYVTGRLVQKE
ncbi:MAG: CopG family antitoxin [Campylobacterales bacterium]